MKRVTIIIMRSLHSNYLKFFSIIILTYNCSKKDIPTILNPSANNDKIKFSIESLDTINTNIITTDSIAVNVSILSSPPTQGVTYSIKVLDSSNSTIYSKDTNSKSATIVLIGKGYQIGKKYTTNITVTSNLNISNTSSKQIVVQRNRVYKNYLRTSYELSNYDEWLSSNDLYQDGIRYLRFNPFMEIQYAQLDINGEGREDILYYQSYDIKIVPTPNPPPVVFMNNGVTLNKINWIGPTFKSPHGVKVLVGDFNNDSLPDVFSLVAIDAPYAGVPNTDFCHLLFNSEKGFNRVKEFEDQTGYWVAGSSISDGSGMGKSLLKNEILWIFILMPQTICYFRKMTH